jgi:hypothetical protein
LVKSDLNPFDLVEQLDSKIIVEDYSELKESTLIDKIR